MNQDYLKSWTMISNEMQKPFQAMMELHVNTLKNLRFLRPEELSNLHQPAELLNRQLALAMENSHNILNYMHKSFQIFENVFLSLSKDMSDNARQSFRPIKIEIEDEEERPASRKPTAKKASSTKAMKATSQKPQTKAKTVASKIASTQSKTATASNAKSPAKKVSTLTTKKAQPAKNKTEAMHKISPQERKTTSAKKVSTMEKKGVAKAAPKKKVALVSKKPPLAKNIGSSKHETGLPEKKVLEEKMAMPKASTPLVDPKMNFSPDKMPEPKLNMPRGNAHPTEGKMMGTESASNRFQDKNPFRK